MSLDSLRSVGTFFGLSLSVVWCFGCSSKPETPSRADAVQSAADATCDWYQRCDLIGPERAYATRDSCDAQTRSQWDLLWSSSSCEGKIDSQELDACMKAIDATQCQSGLDVFNTLVSKCPESKVCGG